MVIKSDSVLKRIIEWCEEMVLGHHIFYLWDDNEKNYYMFMIYELAQKGPHKFHSNDFKDFFNDVKEKKFGSDIIYDDYGFKLIVGSPTLTRLQNYKIQQSIEKMVLTGEFKYVVF